MPLSSNNNTEKNVCKKALMYTHIKANNHFLPNIPNDTKTHMYAQQGTNWYQNISKYIHVYNNKCGIQLQRNIKKISKTIINKCKDIKINHEKENDKR